jgi:hypothetical protein
MYLPPGFDGREFPLPRATIEAFASLRSIFSQLLLEKGGRGDFWDSSIIHQSSSG